MTPEAFEKIIRSLKSDLRVYGEMMKEVALDIIREGFSSYPVFVATTDEVKLGELILYKDDYAATFSIYASTLEEMTALGLIQAEKKHQFIINYKDARHYMCVLLIAEGAASIAFYPYHTSNTEMNESE